MLINSSEPDSLPQVFPEQPVLQMWSPPLKVMSQLYLVAGANNLKTQEVDAGGLLRVQD